jgi:hypothetical protein
MSLLGATILTAIATLALAVLAFITAIFALLAFRKQSQEVGLLLEQNKRDTDERRRAQAARVFLAAPLPITCLEASYDSPMSLEVAMWVTAVATVLLAVGAGITATFALPGPCRSRPPRLRRRAAGYGPEGADVG